MRSILDINGKPPRSIGARRIGSLYSTGEGGQADRKAATGVYLLDRIEAALDQAGGDPAEAAKICGVAEREIAKIQELKARAEEEAEADTTRPLAAERRREALKSPITVAELTALIDAAKVYGGYLAGGRALGWPENRIWAVHRNCLAKGLISRKVVRR